MRPSTILFLTIIVACSVVGVIRDGWMTLVYGLLMIPVLIGLLSLGLLLDRWFDAKEKTDG